jgi:hypothetical protein
MTVRWNRIASLVASKSMKLAKVFVKAGLGFYHAVQHRRTGAIENKPAHFRGRRNNSSDNPLMPAKASVAGSGAAVTVY